METHGLFLPSPSFTPPHLPPPPPYPLPYPPVLTVCFAPHPLPLVKAGFVNITQTFVAELIFSVSFTGEPC